MQIRGAGKDLFLVWDGALDLTVLLASRGSRHLSYDVWSELRERDPERLRAAGENYSELFSGRDLRLLTHHELLPETQDLLRRITENQTTAFDKAVAIEQWLSGTDFEYTLDVPALPPLNAIDVFINNVRRGHCELYASALVLMLRGLGIPARVVSGFRGAEWNESDQSYTVRASMAHLWAEVYFPGEGWIVFDPAPQENPSEVAGFRRFLNALSTSRLKAKMIWYQEVIGFSRESQIERLRTFSIGLIQSIRGDGINEGLGVGGAGLLGGLINLPLALFASILLFVALVWRRRSREMAPLLTQDQTRAVHLYKRVLRRAARYGADGRGKTAEELRQELEGNGWPEGIFAMIDLYNEVRFGKRPFPPGRYAELRKSLRSLRPG
ncbi:MAG: transglutaminase domain-containing protein [Proteobacteria bacterium]|nr:transglutaminase domain-containing protein [Pseudomonadota bacterium]